VSSARGVGAIAAALRSPVVEPVELKRHQYRSSRRSAHESEPTETHNSGEMQ
jgi:hypothetical protein